MLILEILLGLLCIILLLFLVILFIPFGYRIKAVCLDEKSIRFSAFWFFGLFGFSGNYVLNRGFESMVNVLGLKIEVGKKAREKKDKKTKKKKIRMSFSAEAIKYVLTSIKKILLHFLPDRIEGYGRLGFYDPYYTGIICSIIETLRNFRFHNLNLKYVFDDEIYEGEIYAEGRIVLAYIVFIAARLYLNKSTRKIIFS